MSNKLEKKALKQINEINSQTQINEGWFSRLITKLFFSGQSKRIMKQAVDAADGDPEIMAALSDMTYNAKNLKKLVKTLCKRSPGHPKCD